MKNYKYNTSDAIKAQKQIGDYLLISKILNGAYSAETVKSQILGRRTLKEPVIDAANQLFESRELSSKD